MEKNKKVKIVSPGKAFVLGMGVLVASGAVYYGAKQLRKRRSENNINLPENVNDGSVTISQTYPSSTKSLPTGNDGFPLKKGSKGERVKKLQLALKNILGDATMAKYTAIDGIFGKGTIAALKAASLPVIIDEPTFNKLTGSISVTQATPVNLTKIGLALFRFANGKNFTGVIEALKQINNTQEYEIINKQFIKLQFLTVSKSIVTFLLDAFAGDVTAKEQIKNEFHRIGLKLNEETGKWSLSGISTYKDIKTLRSTYVVDKYGNHFKINANTILGEVVNILNGMTHFKSVDGMVYKVPTQDVKYTGN